MVERTHLGDMLRSARKSCGLTLENVADSVGITPGALSHIESGRRLPDPKNAVRIASEIGLSEELVLQALDDEHANRRRSAAWGDPGYRSSNSKGARRSSQPDSSAGMPVDRLRSDDVVFRAQSVNALFDQPSRRSADPYRPASPTLRETARWSDDTEERLHALEMLGSQAADAIRTLRGLTEDENPLVRREARRMLLELDVRAPEE